MRSHSLVVGLLLVSFGLCSVGFFDRPFLTWDDSNFAFIGLPPENPGSVVESVGLSYFSAKPAAFVTISLSYLLFGINPWAPSIVSLLLTTVLLSVVYQWSRQASGSTRAGIVAVALLGSSYSLNLFSRWQQPQVPQMLFLALMGLALTVWSRRRRTWWLRLAGVLAAVAMLYHYLTAYVVIAVTLWLLFACPDSKMSPRAFGARIRDVLDYGLPIAAIILTAIGLSYYVLPSAAGGWFSSARFYYLDTFRHQLTELGQGRAPAPWFYLRAVAYYEGLSVIGLLLVTEWFFIRCGRGAESVHATLLRLWLYVSLFFLVMSSSLGADARPRALAGVLPAAAVYLGIGVVCTGDRVLRRLAIPAAFHPGATRVVAAVALVGSLAIGVIKSYSLFQITHPYYAIRHSVSGGQTPTLIGWRIFRVNELKFMARDLPTMELLLVDSVEELQSACSVSASALLIVDGRAAVPDIPGLHLAARFDNPTDTYVPALLAEGVSQLALADPPYDYDLPLTPLASKYFSDTVNGYRLYELDECGEAN